VKLYIARHGEASFNAKTDRERPLTPNGIKVTKSLMGGCFQQLKEINLIWSSDLLRARETAAIYSQGLGIKVEENPKLSPDGEPKKILQALSGLKSDDSILIVSHQPVVGELVSLLCEGDTYHAHPYCTSEIVVIECEMLAPGLGQKISNFKP